ncbi:MAG: UbiA family prenyltransferase [Bacteroidota bacterium]
MLRKSTWLHLRIPFSFFLLPIFLFAQSVSPNIIQDNFLLVLIILHIFLYPASNGYNSYFDKDEESIGGLKHPPKVTKGLYYTALLFDLVALGLGLLIGWQFTIMLLIYGLVSKAYSHPMVRLKKYPFASWFVAGFFQGFFTFIMAFIALNNYDLERVFKPHILIPALLSSLFLWGSYPMTQVYQHGEDSRRGDKTLSILLGIKGTFYFTVIMFTLTSVGFVWYFWEYHKMGYAIDFLLFLVPVVLFFSFWFLQVIKNPAKADYAHAMWLNSISSLCMSAFFIYFFLNSTQLIQAIQGGF